MGNASLSPQTPEERLIWWAIVGTWALWLAGALYHVLPVLGWALAALGLWRLVERGGHVPAGVLVWAVAVFALLIALVAGHVDFGLDGGVLAKSIAGWGKGWALFAVLTFAGSLLVVRPAIVWRASAILGAQSIAFGALFVVAAVAGLPGTLFVSPLVLAGGGDRLFFEIGPYLADPGLLGFRLRFFAPWSPAAALAGAMIAVLAAFDRDPRWAATGIAAGLFMGIMAQSRLGVLAVVAVALLVPVLTRAARPATWAAAGGLVLLAGLGADMLLGAAEQAIDAFTQARADSSRVRTALQNIALHRWLADAPVFGHGVVERGPHLVEFMPIGSHHTWFSLLFVKGLVGCIAFAAALGWTLAEMLVKAQHDATAKAGLAVALVLAVFSFGENLEILAYLVWPALLVLGMAMRRRRRASDA